MEKGMAPYMASEIWGRPQTVGRQAEPAATLQVWHGMRKRNESFMEEKPLWNGNRRIMKARSNGRK